MAPYSMDLRGAGTRAWDAGGDAVAVAARYGVSRAWVYRLIQRRRETGSMVARKQPNFGRRSLAGQEERLARLDHRAAGCDVRGVAGGLADDRRAEHAVAEIDRFGLPSKKPYTPTKSSA